MSDLLTIFTPEGDTPDAGAIKQMENCLRDVPNIGGVLSADHHLGYSMPIGGTIAYLDHLSPSGVGFDIGCGNMAVSTSLFYGDVSADLSHIMDEVARRISFGMGRPNNEPVDHPVLDKIRAAEFRGVQRLAGVAAKQLGTVGGGNHYIDLFRDEATDRIWIGVHFGSRGFGHKIASGFMAMAHGGAFEDRPPNEDHYSPPVLLDARSSLGYAYREAMELAGEYAYGGRETAVAKVLEILGNPAVLDTIHNHHNFSWLEEHDGVEAWVVRKGATPLFPGQRGFVGGSMGENAVIIQGIERDYEVTVAGSDALWSAPHGAGRAMSRTEAKGKSRKRCQCVDPKLTRALIAAVEKQPPPRTGVSRPKLRYAHQGGSNPPLIIIHGSGLDQVPQTYQRYLENMFRETFKLEGTPLRVEFRTSRNPYAGKRPAPLSEAEEKQAHRRRRYGRKHYD